MIEVNGLSVKYPSGKGVFDLDFKVESGEVTGYLGPNGAGKTTTIRALLGFMRPTCGSCSIAGRDCWSYAPDIQRTLGYIPGETSFFGSMSGLEFLKLMRDMRGMKSEGRQKQLLDMFELDAKGGIKKFSKGMKQKLAITAAFMHEPEVLILDEPTSGLDPLMQNRFVELILSEKKKGRTILMSSHIFEEIEKTCGSVLIIKDGRLAGSSDVRTLKSERRCAFVLRVDDPAGAATLLRADGFSEVRVTDGEVEAVVAGELTDTFIKSIARMHVHGLDVRHQSLEDVFMCYYAGDKK